MDSRAVVLNLRVGTPFGGGGQTYQIPCILDIYIRILNSKEITIVK